MHFFITGHTGFKGSWLTSLLRKLGHDVSGYSREVRKGGLFAAAHLERDLFAHNLGDVRDASNLARTIDNIRPDFILHLAAQPIVLDSYENPAETFTTNVSGTLNLLQAVTESKCDPLTLVVTTDKVYRDTQNNAPFKESDSLGGHDPYAASKAMADLLTQSWAATHNAQQFFIARAGNVIGAYDDSPRRLVPDAVRAIGSGGQLALRYPDAVRPWQHVLDCLAGYLHYLGKATTSPVPTALNFGPDPKDFASVRDVITLISNLDNRLCYTEVLDGNPLHETLRLRLDSSLANQILGWGNVYDLKASVSLAIAEVQNPNPRHVINSQIDAFLESEQGENLRKLFQ